MLDYAETRKCRVQYLLEYFVEEVPPCAKCDNCTGRNQAALEAEDEQEEDDRPHIEIPEAPPPPRKDPTTMF
jgi:superfamily II DNA helicase RecQ